LDQYPSVLRSSSRHRPSHTDIAAGHGKNRLFTGVLRDCPVLSYLLLNLIVHLFVTVDLIGARLTPLFNFDNPPLDCKSIIIAMRSRLLQSVGIAWTILYSALIIWIYATEPRTFKEAGTVAQVAVGTYQIDQAKFDAGLGMFQRDQFRASREEWALADPAQRDARTQFYIAYSFYREGWGRVYNDKELFTQGLEAVNRTVNLPTGSTLSVEDAGLKLHTPAELKAELELGVSASWSDLNPLKVFRERK
jgi:hypothetical protein